MRTHISWHIYHFKDLSTKQFHDLLQLRIKVFVVEQICPYPELDNKDLDAYHIIGLHGKKTIATARILKPGVSYPQASIGRVVVDENYRKQKLGDDLMQFSMQQTQQLFPNQDVKISAQEYLKHYYEKHGFEQVSEMYLEDDIPHIAMLYTAQK